MRTVGLSLGLALLCWLRVDAGGPGAVGLDKSKVIRSIPGREGGSVALGHHGGDRGGVWVPGTPQPPLALLSQPGDGTDPAPAQVPQRGLQCLEGTCESHGMRVSWLSSGAGDSPCLLLRAGDSPCLLLPAPRDSQPTLAARLKGDGTSSPWPLTPRDTAGSSPS